MDCIDRNGVSAWLDNMGRPSLANAVLDKKRFPSVLPDQIERVVHCGECIHMTPAGHCFEFADDCLIVSASDYCSRGIAR